MTGTEDLMNRLGQGDHSWLLLTDLDKDQVDLLEAIWYVALLGDSSRGAGLSWPSWRRLDQYFFEMNGKDPAEVFKEMPSYDMRGVMSSYGLVWRSEGPYASPSPRDDELVGLTIAGLVQLARHRRPNVQVFADELVKVIQTLAQESNRIRRESDTDADRDLDEFVRLFEPPRLDRPYATSVESVGQVLQRESVGVVHVGDRWVVQLGGTRLRKYLTTETAGTYIRQVAETLILPTHHYPGDQEGQSEAATSMQIRLEKAVWSIGEPLDADTGAFGKVFAACGPAGEPAVAKFVTQEPGATREALIGASLPDSTNVIPVLDSGEHDGQWVLIMPRAQMSLQQRLHQTEPVELAECVRILTDIAQALASLDGSIVHRDLKPANVLLLNGRWCLADFGISKYADAATATQTRKGWVTHEYAAPEQWRLEHATAATDVYAFGVMAYQILEGRLPFPGPLAADFREQHLMQPPPTPTAGTDRLRSLIMDCMDKAPEARPQAASILARLAKVTVVPALTGAQRLAILNAEEVSLRAQAQAEQGAAEDEGARRERLFNSASRIFESIAQPLLAFFEDDAPTVSMEKNDSGDPLFLATLRGAKLALTRPYQAPDEWGGPFTVIANAAITVHRSRQDGDGWLGRSHSLWYCDPKEAGRFGWYELAFMPFAFSHHAERVVPYARDAQSAAIAFSGAIGTEKLAWPVTEIDREDPSEFHDRWLNWFADAVSGTLTRPATLPDREPGGSWRRSQQ
ncbi:serine/threonine-protein kinase [Sinomonas sp. P47F7]|uniref:serine/threonine-protein kinase n=1 Tax=Sinomonas sp. P47F7 TaxID=3410987 RepID=UPI003BF4B7A2